MGNSRTWSEDQEDNLANVHSSTKLVADAKLGPKALSAPPLTKNDLLDIQRSAKEAITAMNCKHKPFIDQVANPLRIVALVDMALKQVKE